MAHGKYRGCWKDASSRAMTGKHIVLGSANKVSTCVNRCRTEGKHNTYYIWNKFSILTFNLEHILNLKENPINKEMLYCLIIVSSSYQEIDYISDRK